MSVYRDPKSPYYQYSFQIRGNRFYGSTKCTSHREAEQVEKAEKEKAKRRVAEQQSASTSLLLDHIIDRYWEETGRYHIGADHTFRDLGRLIDFFGKDKLLTEITDDDVARLVAWRRGHRVRNRKPEECSLISNSTVNVSTTEVLKKLFTCAKRKWNVRFEREPNWKAHRLPTPTERVRELVGDEGDRLEAATREDYRPFLDFVRESGLRRNECLFLRWSEVNWGGGQIVKLGKHGKRITTPLTPTIRAILEPLQGHHPEFVFTYVAQYTARGKIRGRRYPLTLNGLKYAWQRLRKKAGVTNYRLHDYRHDLATKLLRETGNLKLVQRALNHADIKTTIRYAHVLDGEVAEAMEQLSQDRRALRNSDENHRKNHRNDKRKTG